uniref:Chitinase-like protein Idgf1 n=1 Tax=Sarcophaga peregrina TaxID=7386 RepID=A0A977JB93_SARPE|nr:chitinase-like protein Idgf1 [Sarcophaga peregrina]
MKRVFASILAFLALLQISCAQQQPSKRVVCYYDSESSTRSGFAQLPQTDLEQGLEFCTHLIYGYAGLTRESFEIFSLNVDRDMFHYRQITALKAKFPQLKIYLSVGGDKDNDQVDPNKYIHFMEGGEPLYRNFIQSSINLLKTNGFDGIDLAFQFPRNKPRKVHSQIGMAWKKFKKLFTGNFIVDPDAETHKQQFTEFVGVMDEAYRIANLSMTLTVLPNVNSTWYFDIPAIKDKFEYVNLFAFDFLTPERNPEEADYTAPIYLKDEQNRLPHYNIDFQVQHWITNGCPANKLNLGIATYARTWKMTTDSELSGMPVVPGTVGPAEAGLQSKQEAGDFRGPNAPIRKVVDLERKYGNYAYRAADDNNEHGIWISFDDPDFAGIKTEYAKQKGLGGIALYDISYDDFRGLCTGARYPILRMVKSLGKLLNPDLEIALQFCSHLVYGYMGIKPLTHQVFSLHEDLDVHKHQFSEITALKRKFPHLKVLLSIGGDKDIDPGHPDKYLELLEGERVKQTAFINTAYTMVRTYGFDGIDLAYQFPKNKPLDPNADMHKEQFTTLIRDLRNVLKPDGLLLTLTVLPNVNSTWYFNVPVVSNFVDFVNLAAFDFLTPDRNPEEADYTAPLYELYDQNRLPHYNADYQVNYWLQHQCPAHKIILGMATYGRAWKMSSDSGTTGEPVVPTTEGPAEADRQSQTPGLLIWPEICYKLANSTNSFLKGANAPLRRVSELYGTYAYRPADSNGEHGIWVSYEDLESASNKASYVRSKGLGGLSFFDLSYDDFRGTCTGDRYPLLRTVKYRLWTYLIPETNLNKK